MKKVADEDHNITDCQVITGWIAAARLIDIGFGDTFDHTVATASYKLGVDYRNDITNGRLRTAITTGVAHPIHAAAGITDAISIAISLSRIV